jgi:hypothetical protein
VPARISGAHLRGPGLLEAGDASECCLGRDE